MTTTAYRTSLVDWINEGMSWTHFITLTTRYPMAVQALKREVERFVRRLETSTQGPVYHLWVAEHVFNGHPHVHMVAELRATMTAEHIASKWTAAGNRVSKVAIGRIDVQTYKPTLPGVTYITKTLPSDTAEWGFNLPRRAEDRARVGPPTQGTALGS